MNGLRETDERIRRVVRRSSVYWDSVGRWSKRAFVAAGGLLLIATALLALEASTGLSPQGPVRGTISFIGIILSYVGLLGLYPRLANRTPRLALAGLVLVGLPAITLIVLLVWGVSSHALSAVPLPPAVIPAFGMILVAAILLFGLGITVFGLAGLRSPDVSRITGVLLLTVATTWFVLFGASLVFGSTLPIWLDSATSGVMGVAFLAIGYHFRADTTARDLGSQPKDGPTS